MNRMIIFMVLGVDGRRNSFQRVLQNEEVRLMSTARSEGARYLETTPKRGYCWS